MAPRTLETDSDRKFLHDLATPLTIARTMVKKLLDELEGRRALSDLQKQAEYLKKTLAALEAIEALHADQKSKLYQREAALPK